MLTLPQAHTILSRLQAAAPPPTADKIAQVMDLLDSLANENAELRYAFDQTADSEMAELLMQKIAAVLKPVLSGLEEQTGFLAYGTLGALIPEQVDMVRLIHSFASGAGNILDGFQQVLKLQHQQFELNPLIFSSTLLLREAQNRVKGHAHMHDHQIQVKFPTVRLQAEGDYEIILDIVTRLLDNSIRYTPAGGTIALSAEDLGSYVLFTVSDNGIGLTPDDMEHVGEPFWRGLHQPLVRQHPGAGLSLYLIRELLALQGGELIFSGEARLGSTFSFTLPAQR